MHSNGPSYMTNPKERIRTIGRVTCQDPNLPDEKESFDY